MNMKMIIGGALLVLTPIAAILAFVSYRSMQASNDWPSAPGVISVSRVVNTVGSKFKADVSYQYAVGGRNFSGTRIRFADTTGSRRNAQENLIKPYPVGREVEVFYDPQNPRDAVLEPGGGLRGLGLILPPLLVGGIGGLFLRSGLRGRGQV